jgi:hypothetical protein
MERDNVCLLLLSTDCSTIPADRPDMPLRPSGGWDPTVCSAATPAGGRLADCSLLKVDKRSVSGKYFPETDRYRGQ